MNGEATLVEPIIHTDLVHYVRGLLSSKIIASE
jgi:hypothetical protein